MDDFRPLYNKSRRWLISWVEKNNIIIFLIFFSAWIISVVAEFLKYIVLLPGCPTSNDSIFGVAGWSIVPFGHTCEWELASGVAATTYPPVSSLLPPIFLLVWGLLIVFNKKSKIEVNQSSVRCVFGTRMLRNWWGLFKSRSTPHTHQLDNGPTSGKNMSVKSLQITSSQTGKDRCPTSVQPG